MLTQARLQALLSYNPAIGVFRWIKPRYGVRVGDVAGSTTDQGYRAIKVDGKLYKAHRLAFLYVEGEMPPDEIDHINGIGDDNRWGNLRHANHITNGQNRKRANRDNKLGFLGVSPVRKRFQATIDHYGKSIYLGLFDTPEQAHAAYLTAKRKLHAGCTI